MNILSCTFYVYINVLMLQTVLEMHNSNYKLCYAAIELL